MFLSFMKGDKLLAYSVTKPGDYVIVQFFFFFFGSLVLELEGMYIYVFMYV